MAISRIEKLMEYYGNGHYKIVLTGGFGTHFNTTSKPHFEYLKQNLLQKGVPEKDIIALIPSQNSVEDATLCYFILEKYKPNEVIVITSDYHKNRAELIFKTVFLPFTTISVIGANSNEIEQTLLEELVTHEKSAIANLIKNGVRFKVM